VTTSTHWRRSGSGWRSERRHSAEQIVRYADAHRIDHIVAGLPLSLEIVAGERQAEAKLEFASQFKREAIVAIGNGRNAEPSGGSTCSNG
jgi:hypothetical protein